MEQGGPPGGGVGLAIGGQGQDCCASGAGTDLAHGLGGGAADVHGCGGAEMFAGQGGHARQFGQLGNSDAHGTLLLHHGSQQFPPNTDDCEVRQDLASVLGQKAANDGCLPPWAEWDRTLHAQRADRVHFFGPADQKGVERVIDAVELRP